MAKLSGQLIKEKYQLGELLGSGGMGEVYRAQDMSLHRAVAMKVMRPKKSPLEGELSETEIQQFTRMFRDEALRLAGLTHPGIPHIYEYFEERAHWFLAMEFIKGQTLETYLKQRGGHLSIEDVLNIGHQLADVLQYLHQLRPQIIFRDLKPANAMIDANNQVFLIDFGIARVFTPGKSQDTHIFLSEGYAAPEQYGNAQTGERADIYSLGATLHHLLSGIHPANQPFFFAPLSIQQPAQLSKLIGRMVEFEQARRPASMGDVKEALRIMIEQTGVAKPRKPGPDMPQAIQPGQPNVAAPPVRETPYDSFGPVVDSTPQPFATSGMVVTPATQPPEQRPLPAMIEQELQLLQRYSDITRDHQSKLANIWADLQKEKASTKAARDQETTNHKENWQRTKKRATRTFESAEDAIQSAQTSLKKARVGSKWQERVAGRSPQLLTIPATSSQSEQLTLYQEALTKASRDIYATVNGYVRRSILLIFSEILLSLLVALLFFIFISKQLPYAFAFPATATYIFLSGSLIFVSLFFFTYSTVRLLRAPIFLARIKASATILWNYAPVMRNVHQRLMLEGEIDCKKAVEQVDQAYQSKLANAQTDYDNARTQIEQDVEQQIQQLASDLKAFRQTLGLAGLTWDEDAWNTWQSVNMHTPVTRIGEYRVKDTHEELTVPALLGSPGTENLLFKVTGAARNAAVNALQSLMLRMLATQAPGKVRFTLIDPVGLGQNVAAFMQLADFDEVLVSSKARTEPQHIAQGLADLSAHMEDVIQKYLRNQYATIDDYNDMAGEVAEPYRVLVVIGFPVKFTEDAMRRIIEIATNGPRCGVFTLIVMDTAQILPRGFNLTDLERVSTIIEMVGNRLVWHGRDFAEHQLWLDEPPPLALFNSIITDVGKAAQTANEVKVPFARIAPPEGQWWTNTTSQGIQVPLGRVGATRFQYLELGKGTAQHILVVGKTGAGKTTLLHTLITNLALTYSPDEIELYLVDFKRVGFTAYARQKLLHARVIATHSEREFGVSVLQELDAELKRREELFSQVGVQEIGRYRSSRPGERMPRILLLVDEFQEFFTQEDALAQQASLFLDRLVRQGRGFGMHVLLGSQTLAGAYSLASATIGQMAIRIALQCEEADSLLILSKDNPAARLLTRPGEAIYNAKNGLVEGNNPFQCAWLPDEELDSMLERIRTIAQRRQFTPTRAQIIFEGNAHADIEKNTLLRKALHAPYLSPVPRVVSAWLGEPIAIKNPTSAQFHNQAGNNLLMIGQEEETALALLITSLYSLAAQYAPGTARFYLADLTPANTTHAGLLPHTVEQWPHRITVVNHRGLFALLTQLHQEVQTRLEHDERTSAPIYLLIHGLQRARDLSQAEDAPSSRPGSETPLTPAQQFTTILRDGSEMGIHTLAWCDTLHNFTLLLGQSALREFEMRVLFHVSPDDSRQLNPYRAIFFNEDTGQFEKFRPYKLPSEKWREWATRIIREK